MSQCGLMSTLSLPVRMQSAQSWHYAVLATQTRLFSVPSPEILKGRALKVGVVSHAPVDLSPAAINARPSAIRQSCTTALHAANLAQGFDQLVSMSVPSYAVKIVVFA